MSGTTVRQAVPYRLILLISVFVVVLGYASARIASIEPSALSGSRHADDAPKRNRELIQRHKSDSQDEDDIRKAIDVLESMGVIGWCHYHEFSSSSSGMKNEMLGERIPPCSLQRHLQEEVVEKDKWFYIQNSVLAALCVVTAALAAGLTMGLLSIDPLLLHIKIRASSSQEEKSQAKRLLPIVKQHHLLLVSLLLLNSIANEALPLFLDSLVGSYMAVILSVTLVLFFGEIIPSALFTGPDQLELAARLAPMVKLVMILLWPIAYPIAKVLDVVLHDENGDGGRYNRGELTALVRIQYEERLATKQRRKLLRSQAALRNSRDEDSQFLPETHSVRLESPDTRASSIHVDEVSMVEGALSMKTKNALDVYTPLHRVFAVQDEMILTERNLVKIYSSGHSRIPVYIKNPSKPKDISRIRGILMSKHLIVVDTRDSRCVSTLPLYQPYCVAPHSNLVDLINMFQTGAASTGVGGHMALVCARPQLAIEALNEGKWLPLKAGLLGIITLEDVLEALLQEQIYDETDRLELRQEELARWAFAKWKKFVWGKHRASLHGAVQTATLRQVDEEARLLYDKNAYVYGSPLS